MAETSGLLPFIHAAVARRHLSAPQAWEAMRVMVSGTATDGQIAALLTALHMKGETAEELAGFARGMREASLPVPFEDVAGDALLDTCGTGGDGHNTFNISTTVAFVVAGCGVRVAKHGNRGVSSLSGSADVLEQLGVKVAVSGEQAARALRDAGICFLYAPAFHPKLKQVQAVRRELKMQTTFNLLGPLANPARTRRQLVGAPSIDAAGRIAGALAELGLERGFVVHGRDGLDEVTLTAATAVFAIAAGEVSASEMTPEDFGLQRAEIAALRGGNAFVNAEITLGILNGERGGIWESRRDIVLANAAMALMAAGVADAPRAGVETAREILDAGMARAKLRQLAEMFGS